MELIMLFKTQMALSGKDGKLIGERVEDYVSRCAHSVPKPPKSSILPDAQ